MLFRSSRHKRKAKVDGPTSDFWGEDVYIPVLDEEVEFIANSRVNDRYRVGGRHPMMVQEALNLRRPGKLSETQQRTLVSCLRSKLMKTPDEMSGA